MAEEALNDRLQELWQQGHRNMAVAFLKRAVTLDSTLAEVAATLQFDAVRNSISSIRLKDVLAPGGTPAAPRQPKQAAAAAPATPAPRRGRGKKKRTRRGPKEMQQIRDHVLGMLQGEPGSLDTNQIEDGLSKEGHKMDRITLNRMLSSLEQEGQAACLGGRPKSWRAKGERQADDGSLCAS